MLLKDYTSNKIPFFAPNQKAEFVYNSVKSLGYSHIFVEVERVYSYAIAVSLLEDNLNMMLEDFSEREFFYLTKDNFLIDNLCVLINNHSNIAPVLGENQSLIGFETANSLFEVLSEYVFFNKHGYYLVIEHLNTDFSMATVSRIVEENASSILGFFVSNATSTHTQALLKITPIGLEDILQSLERYNYRIIKSFIKSKNEIKLIENLNYLQKYLEL